MGRTRRPSVRLDEGRRRICEEVGATSLEIPFHAEQVPSPSSERIHKDVLVFRRSDASSALGGRRESELVTGEGGSEKNDGSAGRGGAGVGKKHQSSKLWSRPIGNHHFLTLRSSESLISLTEESLTCSVRTSDSDYATGAIQVLRAATRRVDSAQNLVAVDSVTALVLLQRRN